MQKQNKHDDDLTQLAIIHGVIMTKDKKIVSYTVTDKRNSCITYIL